MNSANHVPRIQIGHTSSWCFTYLRTIQCILMTCWLSVERSMPFGLLVSSKGQKHLPNLLVINNISYMRGRYLLSLYSMRHLLLKGTATLLISMLYIKELYEPWILIPVTSKSVETYGCCGRLSNCEWTLIEAAIL